MSAAGHYGGSPDLARAMASVAREFFGEPTEEKPSKNELRFRTRGSLAVDTKAGTYFDHEANKGGGVIALVREVKGLDDEGAAAWLIERGHLPKPGGGMKIVASYPYRDAAGHLVFEVVRLDPKDFRQRRPDPSAKGGWAWSMKGVRLVPYRLPDLLAAIGEGELVYFVEGEKAANALAKLGVCATCTPGGANKFREEYAEHFNGADVVVLPDNDDVGRQHTATVARGLQGHAHRVRLLALPNLSEKGDVFDWIVAGGTAKQLEELTETAAEPVEPPDNERDEAAAPDSDAKSKPQQGIWSSSDPWDEASIAPRPWVAPAYFLRGAVTALIGPGGVSKSSLVIAWTIALTLARELHGMKPRHACRCALYSTEDDDEELKRRLTAALIRANRKPADIAGLVLRTGPATTGALFERHPVSGEVSATPAMLALERQLVEFRADILFVDPLAELHGVEENDNTGMRAIIAAFRSLAARLRIAVVIVHHTRKGQHAPGDAEAGRGASAIIGACRVVLTITSMSEEEETALGLIPGSHKHYFRLDGRKANYSALTECEWFERQIYTLSNDDQVAVTVPWDPPRDAVTPEVQARIEAAVRRGTPSGPLSAQLGGSDRSIKHAMIAAGINTQPGQKEMLAALIRAGFQQVRFRDERRKFVGGLRSPEGLPKADWEDKKHEEATA